MTSPRFLLTWVVLGAVTLGGCLGGGGDGGDSGDGQSTSSRSTGPASFTGGSGGNTSTSNATTNGTTNSTAPDNATQLQAWSYDNRTGQVSGVGLLVQQPEADEPFTVGNASRLLLNLSVEGDELTLTVRPPGCMEASCEQTATTSGGSASLAIASPDAGDWRATLTAEGAGPQDAQYELSIGQLLAAGNATY